MRYSVRFLSLILFGLSSCSTKENEEFTPKLSNVTESVYASGIIKAENQYTVFSSVSGVLQKINVSVGQTINNNQVLFNIENDKASLNTENARLAYELSKEDNRYIQDKIADMETRVQMAKDKLEVDESLYNRNKRVKEYKVISEVEYERVEFTYKNSKSNYQSTLKQLSQLKAQLKNDQNRNSINLQINQKSQNDFHVKSAFAGELFDILVKEGSYITPQNPLAIIGKKNAFLIELDVDENDMVRVVVGQKVIITLDSYKGQVFEATVNKIYPIMDERSRTFKIEANFDNLPAKLYPNLTAEANIIIQTKKNVLTIPKNYIIDEEYVLVNENEKRKVKIGLSDYQNAEILEGLQANETIYKPK